MTLVSPEGKNNFRGDTLPKRPVASEISMELTVEENELKTFEIIDQEVSALIGVFGKNLSEVQAATMNTTILVDQTSRMLDNSDIVITDAIETKKKIRFHNELLSGPIDADDVVYDDIEMSVQARHDRIIDALLATRNARESSLEQKVHELELTQVSRQRAIDSYRQSLLVVNPAALEAFDLHFSQPITRVEIAPSVASVETDRTWMEKFRSIVAPLISGRALKLIGIYSPKSAEVMIIPTQETIDAID